MVSENLIRGQSPDDTGEAPDKELTPEQQIASISIDDSFPQWVAATSNMSLQQLIQELQKHPKIDDAPPTAKRVHLLMRIEEESPGMIRDNKLPTGECEVQDEF